MEEDWGQNKLLGSSKTFEQDVENTWCSLGVVDQLAPFVLHSVHAFKVTVLKAKCDLLSVGQLDIFARKTLKNFPKTLKRLMLQLE